MLIVQVIYEHVLNLNLYVNNYNLVYHIIYEHNL